MKTVKELTGNSGDWIIGNFIKYFTLNTILNKTIVKSIFLSQSTMLKSTMLKHLIKSEKHLKLYNINRLVSDATVK